MEKLIEKIEKILIYTLIICGVMILLLYLFVWSRDSAPQYYEEDEKEVYIIEEEIESKKDKIGIRLTVYNPVSDQCDSTPDITADNSKIDMRKLKNGNLRWVAVSRDLLAKSGGFGKKIKIHCPGDPSLSGIYEIHDVMNKRYRESVDVLFHQDIRTVGAYKANLEFLD